MAEVENEPKTVRLDFSQMLQSQAAQTKIMKEIAPQNPPELGKAVPKEK